MKFTENIEYEGFDIEDAGETDTCYTCGSPTRFRLRNVIFGPEGDQPVCSTTCVDNLLAEEEETL